MTEDEKFVREHWPYLHQGEATNRIYLNGLDTNSSQTAFVDWAAAAEFTRQRLEEIRQTQEGIEILSRVGATGNTNGQLQDCARAIARILAREQELLASLKKGMKEPQP